MTRTGYGRGLLDGMRVFRVARMALLAAALMVVLTALIFGRHGGAATAPAPDVLAPNSCDLSGVVAAQVTEVVDGQTLYARVCGDDVAVRVLGIDAPSPDECYGPQARDNAVVRLTGKDAMLAADPGAGTRDSVGRYLFRVAVDGSDYGTEAVSDGYAHAEDHGHHHDYTVRYAMDQVSARTNGYGLWGACPE
jgi:endonuclease YncB( thermonuclease family)